jgi:hypothetical protein
MKMLALATFGIAAVSLGCSGGGGASTPSAPTSASPSLSGVITAHATTPSPSPIDPLPPGLFIDSWFWPNAITRDGSVSSFQDVILTSDALVIAEVTSIVDSSRANVQQTQPEMTFGVRIEQWIKGSGPDTISVRWWGSLTVDGPRFFESTFVPQVGRKYFLALTKRRPCEFFHGDYQTSGFGSHDLEVTDGRVHVLRDSRAQYEVGRYAGLPVAEFVSDVEAILAPENAPSITPNPLFSCTPTPSRRP